MPMLILPLVFALTAATPRAQPPTKDAVIAADDAWLRAEVAGDAEFLDGLLLPNYVSVAASGKVTLKSQIVANARARDADARTKLATAVASWKASHPIKPDVLIIGDTAILKWVLVNEAGSITSSDMFVYRGGRWRAIYSQHTTAAN